MRSNRTLSHTSREIGTTLIEYALLAVCASSVVVATGTYVGRNSSEAIFLAGKSISMEGVAVTPRSPGASDNLESNSDDSGLLNDGADDTLSDGGLNGPTDTDTDSGTGSGNTDDTIDNPIEDVWPGGGDTASSLDGGTAGDGPYSAGGEVRPGGGDTTSLNSDIEAIGDTAHGSKGGGDRRAGGIPEGLRR